MPARIVPHHQALTLLELVMVLAMIGILAALLFPSIAGAIDQARRIQARNDAIQIATAITAYEADYGRLPSILNEESQAVGEDLLKILTGNDADNNPKEIPFLDVPIIQSAGSGKSGQVHANGAYRDPWGVAYQVNADSNDDNKIKDPYGTTIQKKVIVWSLGKDKVLGTSSNDPDDPKSW